MHDLALVDDHGAVGEPQGPFDVPLDQEQCLAFVAQAAEQRAHLRDQNRHDTLRGLVEQDHLGLADQRACDRQHLLLAARERPD
jgi:hypothetical protein